MTAAPFDRTVHRVLVVLALSCSMLGVKAWRERRHFGVPAGLALAVTTVAVGFAPHRVRTTSRESTAFWSTPIFFSNHERASTNMWLLRAFVGISTALKGAAARLATSRVQPGDLRVNSFDIFAGA